MPSTEIIDDHREDLSARRSEKRFANLRRKGFVARYPGNRNEVKKHGAGRNVDHRQRDHAERQGPRQISFGIADLARQTRKFPPSRKGKESSDQPASHRAEHIGGHRKERFEVREIAASAEKSKTDYKEQKRDLEPRSEPLRIVELIRRSEYVD